jgi:hypothetical protein
LLERGEEVSAMEKRRRIWREGLCPQLSTAGLQALKTALVRDDQRLLQGTTCYPPLLDVLQDRAVEACCALSFCGWQGDSIQTVSQLDQFFQRLCDTADLMFSDAAACRFFLNWYDDPSREEMRQELLAEVTFALEQRRTAAA